MPVPVLWPGETVMCIATGPSLTADDVDYVRNKARVICVNDAWMLAPWADVLYAADAKWWRHHKGVKAFAGLKYSIHPNAIHAPSDPGVHVLKNTGIRGLEPDRTGLRTGQNSGYQAIGLARHFGASRIGLLGYDMQQKNGWAHFFGDHPPGMQMCSPFAVFRQHYETIVQPLSDEGIAVVNCSRDTALTCFPRQALETFLPC